MNGRLRPALVVALACMLIVLGPVSVAIGADGGAGRSPVPINGGGGSGDETGGDGGTEPPCSPPVVCEISASGPGNAAAPPPPWYTQAIHEKVLEAKEMGLGYNAAIDQYVPVNVSFIRPGAWMVWPSWCTMGFVTGSPGAYRILTAGHCFEWADPQDVDIDDLDIHESVDPDGEVRKVERALINPATDKTVVLAVGSEKAPDVFVAISNTVAWHDSPDYAVVEIDADWLPNVDPTVEKILGPEGPVYDSEYGMDGETPVSQTNPLVVKFVGHGVGLGAGGMPRTGLVTRVDVEKGVAYCHCPIIEGDSGGPVLVETPDEPFGRAYGLAQAGMPETCLIGVSFDPTKYCRGQITLLSVIPEDVMDQRIPNPSACQGEIRLDFTTSLEQGTIPDEVRDLAVPYAMVYDDRNHNGRMDQGEHFQNKVSEARWILRYYQDQIPPPPSPPGMSGAQSEPEDWFTIEQQFRDCP